MRSVPFFYYVLGSLSQIETRRTSTSDIVGRKSLDLELFNVIELKAKIKADVLRHKLKNDSSFITKIESKHESTLKHIKVSGERRLECVMIQKTRVKSQRKSPSVVHHVVSGPVDS